MKPIDEAEHIRVMLKTGSMMTHEQKMNVVGRIRDNAIAAIVKIRPETITEGHDLTAPYQAYHFISELRQEAIPPELAAKLDLLEACTNALHHGQINENAICHAYAKTDGHLIMGENTSKTNSVKAQLPRGIIREIKTELVKQYPDFTAKELWPHLYDELDKRQLDPKDGDDGKLEGWLYTYDHKDGSKTIMFRTFANIKINE